MYYNDEMQSVQKGQRSASSGIFTPAHQATCAKTEAEAAMLFEDILDIECPVRLALSSDYGLGEPGMEQIERGIGELAGRIPESCFARLRKDAQALRLSMNAKDLAEARKSQAALTETLVSLRRQFA